MNIDTKRLENNELDFREVMQIPMVKKGEKLATIVLPTNGIDGVDVRGKIVKSQQGNPVVNKPGKMLFIMIMIYLFIQQRMVKLI